MDLELGDRVKDRISNFQGIAVARTEWLTGCVRVTISPESLDKDGKPQEYQSFDLMQLKVLDKNVIQKFLPVVVDVSDSGLDTMGIEVRMLDGEGVPPGGPQQDSVALRRNG